MQIELYLILENLEYIDVFGYSVSMINGICGINIMEYLSLLKVAISLIA